MSLIMTKDKSSEIQVGEIIIKSGDWEKVLGVKIQNFIFYDYLKRLTENCEH